MKAIVNRPLNERSEPSVNATITNVYSVNNEIEVVDALPGDDYDGDDTWYRLGNGNYVWSGAADLMPDDSRVAEEDKSQYVISFRKVFGNGCADLNSTEVPDRLYFAPVRMGTAQSSVRFNELIPQAFATGVAQSVSAMPSARKHVFIYIHGFQPMSGSLGLNLLDSFTRNYMTQPVKKIAKVLLMTWPAQSWGRKYIDDRTIKAGRHFTTHNLFDFFTELSAALALDNRSLNLVVHSFGHQLLNGILNPPPVLTSGANRIFENIFLMAPDITYLSMQPGGARLPNYDNNSDQAEHIFNYDNLNLLTRNIHVFYDEHDFVLYSSTKKFVSDHTSRQQTDGYRNLGNYGDTLFSGPMANYTFRNIDQLPQAQPPVSLLQYPFQGLRRSHERAIQRARQIGDYGGINLGRIVLNRGRFTNRHRYLFTSKAVVEEVLRVL